MLVALMSTPERLLTSLPCDTVWLLLLLFCCCVAGAGGVAAVLLQDVDFPFLAHETKNYTGAELEGLVRDAGSHALIRISDKRDVTKTVSTKDVMLMMEDFRRALEETVPQFGTKESDLVECYRNGFVNYGEEYETLVANLHSFTKQVEESDRTPLLSVLVEGPPGSGKTAITAKVRWCGVSWGELV